MNEDTVNLKIIIPKTSRLAYLNNNPGNLRFANQKNAIQGYRGFAKFRTVEDGFQGLINQIVLDQSRNLTLKQFVTKYSPPSKWNNTADYIYMLSTWCGSRSNTNIASIKTELLAEKVAWIESNFYIEK